MPHDASRSAGPFRFVRRALTALALVLIVGTSQCVCQANKPDAEPAPVPPAKGGEAKPAEPRSTPTQPQDAPVAKRRAAPEIPKLLDVKDLDLDEKELLHGVLTQQFDPCGEPRSFLESLESESTCELAKSLGAFTVDMVAKGLSKKQIVGQLLKKLARATAKVEPDLDGSPHYGDTGAQHVIVEYTDFQCPFCKMASKPLKEVAKKYGAVLYLKHMPLSIHPHAKTAALASLAAHQQGKFWEMHDLLFDNQARLDPKVIRELADKAGCDMPQFDADMKSEKVAKLLERDIAEGDRFELEGTPTVFLDGFMVELHELEDKLEAAE